MEDEVKQMLVAGLNSSPMYIPCWYNYDDQGSTLQQESGVLNQDYYLTRSQISFLQHRVQDIIPDVPNGLTLVDLGSGDCSKTRFVIDELIKRQSTLTFYPLDISGDFLLKAAAKLREEYDDSLAVFPVASDYVQGINRLKQVKGAKLILWIGSMINLPYEDQISTLRLISTMMTDQCRLVFTADITESRDVILKAYNDDAVTRLNREEGSMINIDKFSYHLDFVRNTNPQYMSYVTSYVVAKEDIQFTIPGLGIDLVMAKGEQLFFHEGEGLSCKYTLEQLQTIVEKAGLRMIGSFMDTDKHVAFCQCATK